MPTSQPGDRTTADNLRRGAMVAAARGLGRLADMLNQRAAELEAGDRKAA